MYPSTMGFGVIFNKELVQTTPTIKGLDLLKFSGKLTRLIELVQRNEEKASINPVLLKSMELAGYTDPRNCKVSIVGWAMQDITLSRQSVHESKLVLFLKFQVCVLKKIGTVVCF